MRISFSCMGGGFSIDTAAVFSRSAYRFALMHIRIHLASCPYCTFKKDVLTNREAASSFR